VSGVEDVRTVCKEREYSCEGAVNVKHTGEYKPHKQVRLADDIIKTEMCKQMLADPSKAMNPDKLRSEIIEKHGSKSVERHNVRAADDNG